LGRIVRLLMSNATVVVSGTKVAEEIGTSRSEVWRLIQQLRGLGVDVAGHLATGYQLRAVPDLLLPEMLAPSLKGTIFGGHSGAHSAKLIHHYYTWHSARSTGIYCSVILRPAMPPSDALIFSLAAGLAVRAAVAEIASQLQVDLKWPNDLLVGGKKFCGILTEMNAEATRVRHLVVGVGINVNQVQFPAELRETATSLRIATGTEWSRVELCAALLKSLDREYRALLDDPGAHSSIRCRFEESSSSVRGRKVSVRVNSGLNAEADDETNGLVGVTEGLDDRGFLRVRTAKGLTTVVSGTVKV
jgi:BirA family biotin operon repressor/biotin-[acetyl-CoA-carboxylase] ligase